jgi:hypothetical protein
VVHNSILQQVLAICPMKWAICPPKLLSPLALFQSWREPMWSPPHSPLQAICPFESSLKPMLAVSWREPMWSHPPSFSGANCSQSPKPQCHESGESPKWAHSQNLPKANCPRRQTRARGLRTPHWSNLTGVPASMEVWAQHKLPNSVPETHPDSRPEMVLSAPCMLQD